MLGMFLGHEARAHGLLKELPSALRKWHQFHHRCPSFRPVLGGIRYPFPTCFQAPQTWTSEALC